jgi:hypothetical protein
MSRTNGSYPLEEQDICRISDDGQKTAGGNENPVISAGNVSRSKRGSRRDDRGWYNHLYAHFGMPNNYGAI